MQGTAVFVSIFNVGKLVAVCARNAGMKMYICSSAFVDYSL